MVHTDILKTGAFPQRFCDKFKIQGNITSVAVNNEEDVFAVGDGAFYRITKNGISKLESEENFKKVICDRNNRVIAVTTGKVIEIGEKSCKALVDFNEEIRDIAYADKVYVLTKDNLYYEENGEFKKYAATQQEAFSLAVTNEKICACNSRCVQRMEGKRKEWRNIFPDHSTMPFMDILTVCFDKIGYLWVGSEQGAFIYDYRNGWYSHKQISCLPEEKVYSITACDDGSMLLGTNAGAVLIKTGSAKYLPATRYSFSTDVNCVAYKNGSLYTASKGGVVKIYEKTMTLEEKAQYIFDLTEKHFPRKEGFVTSIRGLGEDDDLEGKVSSITDNDGLWTQTYCAAMALCYAVTGDEKALQAARRSFKANLWLTKATEKKGFTARAVRYPDEADWGKGIEEQEIWAEWHRSSDGTYEWLGETSSDEMTGHYMGFSLYYDLCANEEEKSQIREAVCDITDHIIENDGYLVDVDGLPTTWACWNPDELNNNNMWSWERGVNSLEWLTFLKVAYHVSGDEKYNKLYKEYIERHHYLINASHTKRDDGHSCHIDDNLAMCNIITLLRLEEDEAIRNYILMGLSAHNAYTKHEHNPFYNFVYGAFTDKGCRADEMADELRNCPMTLANPVLINSNRKNIEIDETPLYWGEELHIKVPLSWDERPFRTNDQDPYLLDDLGSLKAYSGVTFLFDYWIGRYFGIIE